ncbi:hypothetical protein Bca4012_030425 [Brassica carinata]|uniref:Uncharacterized protein n=1 Tax=Brassica carinata TaxID=52824 RepID=A0A8X7UU50_BRACI|nr:hypothetical protein Bca52824_048285 [Brassica carinata]
MTKMGDAVHGTIAWPLDKIRLPDQNSPTDQHSPTESNKISNQVAGVDIVVNVFVFFGFRVVVTALVVATKVANRRLLSWTVIT